MIETKVEISAIGVEALFLRPDGVADFPGVLLWFSILAHFFGQLLTWAWA